MSARFSVTRHRWGFTLVEVLVVLAVLVALAGAGLAVGRGMLARSRQAACLGQLRSIGAALESYLQDHQRKMPELAAGRASKAADDPSAVLETVLLPYVENNPDAFRCPADREQFAKSGSSYLWNSTLSGLHESQLRFFGIADRPDQIPLVTDKEAWHPGGVNFLYADQTSSNRLRFAAGN